MTAPLRVWLLNPYHTGSHRAWAEGYARHSRHQVRVLSMPGYFWKWRMQGGALEMAAQARALAGRGECPDVILASSMTNLPAFLALTRELLPPVPVVLYMHENQLTYPLPPGTKRDLTYGMIQHLSMVCAHRICFNSQYHLVSWFDEAPRLLRHFPDYNHLTTIAETRARAEVLPVGCDLQRLDTLAPGADAAQPDRAPLILWNQRWEYDKDPETMLGALYQLADEGLPFRVALAGANFRIQPAEFEAARSRLGDRLEQFGFVVDQEPYVRLLWETDVVLSTALHEFFGVGIVEAIYCGCAPVLPDRLSYPELIPPESRESCLYSDRAGMLDSLRRFLRTPADPALRGWVARFDWSAQAPEYDRLLAEACRDTGRGPIGGKWTTPGKG